MAKSSKVSEITKAILPNGIDIIDLPGHFFDMIGIRTSDGTVFLADCISSIETLDKYKFPFIYDVAAYLQTLDKIEKIEAKVFLPAHAPASEDILELVKINKERIVENANLILTICEKNRPFEEILKQIFDLHNLTMNFEQYVLVGSTVKSYLAWLRDNGKLTIEFSNNVLFWRSI
ncbi:hypothetical protein ADH76_01475 [Enterocloster clostridioformis]|nr:hypothetical protein A4V08_02940 [Lachnoclostridium sp. YL32]OXE70161.1 hypothetical protein ADH76_01475 [Enterocloster clostridioformis]